MKKISVVISSLRPDRLEQTIDSTAMHADRIEVVVVSPYKPKPRDFVRHIQVPAPGEKGELTFTQKFNLGASKSACEYVAFDNDDIHFRPGWAPALIRHMEAEKAQPYLAAFHLAVQGRIHSRYTAFGMLYANLGCIRKKDLDDFLGGELFDPRFRMYTSDIDLGLRVWSAGGKVGICHEVVLDADRDTDQVAISEQSVYAASGKSDAKPKKTYRDVWFDHDNRIFFEKWFKKYFWLFWKNYPRLKTLLTNEDGVLPPKRHGSGLLKIMFWPLLNMLAKPKLFLGQENRVGFVRRHWVRVVNRRWGTIHYELPYPQQVVVRR